MAQPLANRETGTAEMVTDSGIDEAAGRLERALARLEAAASRAGAANHSLRADCEKLNGLLHRAEEEIAQLREVTGTVNARLDQVIFTLEQME